MRFLILLILGLSWTSNGFSQEESLEDLLDGFESSDSREEILLDDLLGGFDSEKPDSAVPTDESLDDLLGGFDAVSNPVLNTSQSLLPEGLGGTTGFDLSYALTQEVPKPEEIDRRGLRKLRFFLQLDYRYNLTPTTRIFWDAKVSQDLAYQLRADSTYTEEMLDANEQEVELRETYFATQIVESVDLKIGRQIKVWGKADLLSVLDVLNPKDNREPGLVDIDDSRLPVTMAQLDYYLGDWNLNLVWIHEIRFSKNPVYGSEFFFSDRPLPPEEIPSTAEYGLALNGYFSGWDISFYSANVYNDTGRPEGVFRPEQGQFPNKVVHDRLQVVGVAVSLVEGNWLWRGELAEVQGIKFLGFEEIFARQDQALGFEYTGLKDAILAVETRLLWLKKYEAALENEPNSQREMELSTAIRYQQDFLNQQLSLNFFTILFGEMGRSGSSQRLGFDYECSDGLNVGAGFLFYQTGDIAYATRIADNDRLYANLKYSF